MKSFQRELFEKPYPGRTLIVGMTPSGAHYVQVYWIMGRSANSRNRIFETVDDTVKNTAFDPALLEDPSLIIYYPIRQWKGVHIVSNGLQTDTIHEGLQHHRTFEQSLLEWEFEPDAPHYTPRISAILDTGLKRYSLSILKTEDNDPSQCVRKHYSFTTFTKGIGHCIHTYDTERQHVLKPFDGEPFEVPLFDSIRNTADYYWERINAENKISLAVKFIHTQTFAIDFEIRNKHERCRSSL